MRDVSFSDPLHHIVDKSITFMMQIPQLWINTVAHITWSKHRQVSQRNTYQLGRPGKSDVKPSLC